MENMEGTLTPKELLQEKLDSLQMEHLSALENNDEIKAKEIEEEINRIEQELGLRQTQEAA